MSVRQSLPLLRKWRRLASGTPDSEAIYISVPLPSQQRRLSGNLVLTSRRVYQLLRTQRRGRVALFGVEVGIACNELLYLEAAIRNGR
jgi:hypothetical protein